MFSCIYSRKLVLKDGYDYEIVFDVTKIAYRQAIDRLYPKVIDKNFYKDYELVWKIFIYFKFWFRSLKVSKPRSHCLWWKLFIKWKMSMNFRFFVNLMISYYCSRSLSPILIGILKTIDWLLVILTIGWSFNTVFGISVLLNVSQTAIIYTIERLSQSNLKWSLKMFEELINLSYALEIALKLWGNWSFLMTYCLKWWKINAIDIWRNKEYKEDISRLKITIQKFNERLSKAFRQSSEKVWPNLSTVKKVKNRVLRSNQFNED